MEVARGEELSAGVIFRFGARTEEEMFIAEKRKPHASDFDLGSKEQNRATEERYASLSVWLEGAATVAEAREFVAPSRRLPIWLSVSEIRALPHHLRVVGAPHEKDLPGRNGHCELENVWPSDRAAYKIIRADLLAIATCDREKIAG